MGAKPTPDFSGYATKAGLKCSDGRTIMPDAFKHQDQMTVPLVWQHGHSEPGNVLGHAVLENRADGVYAYGFFNDTTQAQNAKTLVQHKDIVSLSIFANQLIEKSKSVFHGIIREVSLVLSGANPGALIDNIQLQHGDGGETTTLDDEAVIYTGLTLEHDGLDEDDEELEHGDGDTIQDVYDSMSEDQRLVLHYMVGAALEGTDGSAEHSAMGDSDNDEEEKEGRRMSRNVFEQQGKSGQEKPTLTHDALRGIVEDAQKSGSLKEAFDAYALSHGIESIDILFPDAKNVSATPEFDKRRTEWVSAVINGTKHSPFSRIKSLVADLTHEEARAKGYIKGNLKKEEYFGLSKRVTTPSTVYKKQKLDRDDIIDITDFDVVVWLKGEMRLMLDEELARAILIGDGREVDDEDKIRDPAGSNEGAGIRSILNDHELYAATVNVNIDDADSDPSEVTDAIITSMQFYKGSGSPTFYTTLPLLTKLLLSRDKMGRRLYRTASDLAAELTVSNIVTVEVLEDEPDLVGIVVNLSDYTVGADKGGEVNFFDDFDIDYNQYKYLLETRISGALTKIRSALIVKKVGGTQQRVVPEELPWDDAANVIHVPDSATLNALHYTYSYETRDATGSGSSGFVPPDTDLGAPAGGHLTITAAPKAGYYFDNNVEDQWTYTS